MGKKLRVAVVGLVMGTGHALTYQKLDCYELCALCDISEDALVKAKERTGCDALYTDYGQMLNEAKPDVVCVATPNNLHEDMTIQAAHAGVKAVYCEKPITMSMGGALKMQKACRDNGTCLVIGHQRRVSSVYRKMKEIIDSGDLGEIYLMRGSCGGDFLTDGTHTIDSLMFLNDDRPVKWVVSQVYRGRKATDEEKKADRYIFNGTRYGHNIEEGAVAMFEFSNGIRGETQTGTARIMERGYQDIEIFGSRGRLWRPGDQADPPLLLNTDGEFRPVDFEPVNDSLANAHQLTADWVLGGEQPSLGIDTALKGFELVMAIYESARTHSKLELPLGQMEYPLDIALRDGIME